MRGESLITVKRITLAGLGLVLASPLAAQSDRAAEFQSVRINETYAPIFPEQLIAAYRNGGRVRVLASVNREGRLEEWLVLSHTAREFAEAAVAALRRWEFEPARLRGEPVDVCFELTFTFEVKGCVVSVTPMDTVAGMFNSLLDTEEYRPCTLREIDRIPTPLAAHPPEYPQSLAARGISGEITVDFYIDEQGNVRMPFVLGRPPMALAHLAVGAVRQWKFEPPTRRGVPVLVHARQVFHFSATAEQKP
jgi:TonB family protein